MHGTDLRDGAADIGARLEVDLQDADAGDRLRLDAGDAVDGGGVGALADEDDAAFHVLGGQAGIVPHHHHDRDVDDGEDVDDHPRDRQRAQQDDQHRSDRGRVRPAQGEAHQTDHSGFPSSYSSSPSVGAFLPSARVLPRSLLQEPKIPRWGVRRGRRSAGWTSSKSKTRRRCWLVRGAVWVWGAAGGMPARDGGGCARHPGRGDRRLGRDVGGFKANAPANDEPTRGVIYARTVFASPAEMPAEDVPDCGAEGEIAFVSATICRRVGRIHARRLLLRSMRVPRSRWWPAAIKTRQGLRPGAAG